MFWSNVYLRITVASTVKVHQKSPLHLCKICFKLSDLHKTLFPVLVRQKYTCQAGTVNHRLFKFPSLQKLYLLDCNYMNGKFCYASVNSISTSTRRLGKGSGGQLTDSNKTGLIYILAVFIFMLGGAYAGVPLYKVFCQATGLGGQAVKGHDTDKIETMEKVDRKIVVKFNADVASSMRWNFKPQQTEVTVYPGETALAFYTAKNPTDKPIIGISTYNVLPYEAGQYFNKIQCFCFEEQRLNPNEQVSKSSTKYLELV
uniref:Cytochrome c oxidase assembly protein COX11, mitochondrial n=1 Tax=Biomphalaria glabrata TaxID=6526 RepID=A0A2C9K6C4_BIOGL